MTYTVLLYVRLNGQKSRITPERNLKNMDAKKNNTARITIAGSVVIAVILVLGTLWMGQSIKKDTDRTVRKVSTMYLAELAGRREQIVESNLKSNIRTIRTAIDLMTETTISSTR